MAVNAGVKVIGTTRSRGQFQISEGLGAVRDEVEGPDQIDLRILEQLFEPAIALDRAQIHLLPAGQGTPSITCFVLADYHSLWHSLRPCLDHVDDP